MNYRIALMSFDGDHPVYTSVAEKLTSVLKPFNLKVTPCLTEGATIHYISSDTSIIGMLSEETNGRGKRGDFILTFYDNLKFLGEKPINDLSRAFGDKGFYLADPEASEFLDEDPKIAYKFDGHGNALLVTEYDTFFLEPLNDEVKLTDQLVEIKVKEALERLGLGFTGVVIAKDGTRCHNIYSGKGEICGILNIGKSDKNADENEYQITFFNPTKFLGDKPYGDIFDAFRKDLNLELIEAETPNLKDEDQDKLDWTSYQNISGKMVLTEL